MKFKKKSILFLLIISISFLSSCGSMVKGLALKKYTVENGAIPPDFGKDNSTLICVLTGKNSTDKYMKKRVKQNYKGKYVFVHSIDLIPLENDSISNVYSNKEKYRYLFDFEGESHYSSSYGGYVPSSNYFILDRKENITYNSEVHSGFFSRLIQAYMINLEKQRVKNQS